MPMSTEHSQMIATDVSSSTMAIFPPWFNHSEVFVEGYRFSEVILSQTWLGPSDVIARFFYQADANAMKVMHYALVLQLLDQQQYYGDPILQDVWQACQVCFIEPRIFSLHC